MKRSIKLTILYATELPADLFLWLYLNKIPLPMLTKMTIGFSTLILTVFTIFLIMQALMEGD